MRNVILLGMTATLLFSSCKKEEEITEPLTGTSTNKSVDYIPLTIGSFWVYENYLIDTLGNETLLPKKDSIIVDRDTVIGGNTYYVLEGTRYPTVNDMEIINIVRDSVGHLVNENGEVLFSSSNFSDILNEKIEIHNSDTLYTLRYQMETVSNPIMVPAGTFDNIYNYKGTLLSYIPGATNNPRYLNNYYAPDVGKIFETWSYLVTPGIYQKRLVNYNIQ